MTVLLLIIFIYFYLFIFKKYVKPNTTRLNLIYYSVSGNNVTFILFKNSFD